MTRLSRTRNHCIFIGILIVLVVLAAGAGRFWGSRSAADRAFERGYAAGFVEGANAGADIVCGAIAVTGRIPCQEAGWRR